MNKRIRELALQAGGIYHNDDGDELTPALVGKSLEKFAKLIIQDSIDQIQSCLDCTEQNDDFEYGFYRGLECAKNHIEDHFGVEE